jgi:hypothetical protein
MQSAGVATYLFSDPAPNAHIGMGFDKLIQWDASQEAHWAKWDDVVHIHRMISANSWRSPSVLVLTPSPLLLTE